MASMTARELVQVVRCVRCLGLSVASSLYWHPFGVALATTAGRIVVSSPQIGDAAWTLGFVDWNVAAMPQQVVVASGRA